MANGVQGAKSGNMGRVIIIMGSLIIVALVGVIVALVLNLNRAEPEVQEEEPVRQRTVVINEENIEQVVEEMTEPSTPPGYYEASMTVDWNFPNGTTQPSPDAYVENVSTNTNDVYFDLLLRETGEVIYESPVIPLGLHLRNIALDRNLADGTYPCVVEYHLIDERQNTVGTLSMGITVNVGSQ